ncbi:MAG: toll/interleukin-1 receptor domain-containing protein [Acidobacteriota bacterium]
MPEPDEELDYESPEPNQDPDPDPEVDFPLPGPGRPPLRIFVSYSIRDSSFLKELKKHADRLGKPSILDSWTDREVRTGSEWRQDLLDQLEKADLILLLVSPAFLATDYVYPVELKRALERQETGDAQLIPIILRPTDWSSAPFANLQALPSQGTAITEWENEGEAWEDVAAGLQSVLQQHRSKGDL